MVGVKAWESSRRKEVEVTVGGIIEKGKRQQLTNAECGEWRWLWMYCWCHATDMWCDRYVMSCSSWTSQWWAAWLADPISSFYSFHYSGCYRLQLMGFVFLLDFLPFHVTFCFFYSIDIIHVISQLLGYKPSIILGVKRIIHKRSMHTVSWDRNHH